MKNIVVAIISLINFLTASIPCALANQENPISKSLSIIHPEIITFSETVTLDGFLSPKNIVPVFLIEELPIKKLHVSDGMLVKKGQCLLTYETKWLQQKKTAITQQIQLLKDSISLYQQKPQTSWKHQLLKFFHRPDENLELVKHEWQAWKENTITAQLTQLYGELEKLNLVEQQAHIQAPFDGQIVFQSSNTNQQFHSSEKTPIFSIIDTTHMQGAFYANIYQLSQLHIGDAVQMQWNGASKKYMGCLSKVHSIPKEGTQQYEIIVDFSPAETTYSELRIGMIGTAKIQMSTHQKALALPKSCILFEGNQTFVYKVINNQIHKAPIEIGLTTSTQVEIINGIKANDSIIQNGMEQIYEGQIIK